MRRAPSESGSQVNVSPASASRGYLAPRTNLPNHTRIRYSSTWTEQGSPLRPPRSTTLDYYPRSTSSTAPRIRPRVHQQRGPRKPGEMKDVTDDGRGRSHDESLRNGVLEMMTRMTIGYQFQLFQATEEPWSRILPPRMNASSYS